MPPKGSKSKKVVRARYKDLLAVQTPYSFKVTVFDDSGRILYQFRASRVYSEEKLKQVAKEIRE